MTWGRSTPVPVGAGVLGVLATGVANAAALPGLAAPTNDDRTQAIGCMTSAILYEAGFESREGQEAVAEVVLNRLRSPAFPKTVCGVVFQGSQRRTGCQFSFTCDGSMRKALPVDAIERAREVATKAIDGQLTSRISGATHYHADYVSPYWAPTLVRVAAIGRHIFYRQPGATEFSHLARYAASGERMPVSLTAELSGTSDATSNAPPDKSRDPERFMPWGLAPPGLPSNQAAAKR